MNINTLQTLGYVTIEYPPALRRLVHNAVRSWERFCLDLPLETKLRFSRHDRVKDFGYMLRDASTGSADNKELFHVRLCDLPKLLDLARGIIQPEALHYIVAANDLLKGIEAFIREFVQAVECKYGLVGFEKLVMESQQTWIFRFLHYFGSEVLAARHVDRGGFTLHLFESQGGGEYLDSNKQWRPWTVDENSTIIFPGLALQQYSRCLLRALEHRVVATPSTVVDGRFAMVAFFDFPHSHRFDDTRFRTQDFAEGQVYDMGPRELDRYFVRRLESAAEW